jgi:hypothetical protein
MCLTKQQRGLIKYPLPLTHTADFPVVQYADDTILIMEASQGQLFCLKGILQTFSQSTGLKVNHAKSCLMPINISDEKAAIMAVVFGCQVRSYPFTYLGLPMGTTKPKVEDFSPLVSKVERRISTTVSWLSMAGRATMVDSAVFTIPIYTLCSVKMHITNINSIGRARKHGLWRGTDVAGKGKPLVAWGKVTTPKDKGGLGLKNLRIMNEALLIKHLHKFYNKEDVPWVQLIWHTHYLDGQIPHATIEKGSSWFRDIMKFCDHFRRIASANIGPGDTVLLWGDVWNGHHLMSELPRIFSFTRNKNISVAEYCSNQVVQQNFHTPLSQQASQELAVRNRTLTLIEREDDTRSWKNFLVYFSHSTTMSCPPRGWGYILIGC